MKQDETINLDLYPMLKGIVEKSFVSNKDLQIHLKKPADKIIVTIKSEYTAFRKEIERLLKEKGVEIDDRKNILNFIDCSHDIIYKDTFNAFPAEGDSKNDFESDHSDHSDHSKENDNISEIKILNISECLQTHSGEVEVSGNIVGMSGPFKMISAITRECDCGEKTKVFIPPIYQKGDAEKKCFNCEKPYKVDEESIEYKNAITVYLQDNEMFNDIEKLTCIFLDTNIGNIRVGEKVKVLGSLYVRPQSNKVFLIPKVFTEQVEYVNKEQISLSERDIEAIKRFVKKKGDRKIIDALVELFDKSIIGNNIAKEALLISLVSAGNDLEYIRKSRSRNRIHVLLAGPPGVAKSSLLKKAISLISNSRYESVQHSTAKSLTAIVTREDDQYFLRLGPASIAKGSVCALNEIGTMTEDDQNLLLDLMEEGEYTLNKHGFNTKISSPTTIIASSNFRNEDSFDHNYNKESPNYPIPLEKQLLDRFDLVIIIKDTGDIHSLREYTRNKTEYQSRVIPNYDSFVQNYLQYARGRIPKLSPEALEMIQQYYIELQQSNPDYQSKRRFETLIRLCKAFSKLKLKDEVDGEDAFDAMSFYNVVFRKYNGSMAPIPRDPLKITVEKCITYLKENKDNPVSFTGLMNEVCKENEYVKSYLLGSIKEIDERNLSLDKNKKVRRICNLLRSTESIEVVNKNPIKLQIKEDLEN